MIIGAFSVLLLWWAGFVGFLSTGGSGASLFLGVPLLLSATVALVARRQLRLPRPRPAAGMERTATRRRDTNLAALLHPAGAVSAFIALLLWWVGLTGFFLAGGGTATVFLAVPLLATFGALVVLRLVAPRPQRR